MYRNKKEAILYKSNKKTNQILGKRKSALSEIRKAIDKIDNLLRLKTQKMRYRHKKSKTVVEQVNKLKNIRYRLKKAYHKTFVAHTAKWEEIRSDIQSEFKQAKFAIETL